MTQTASEGLPFLYSKTQIRVSRAGARASAARGGLGGALGLELRAAALAVGCLGGGDLGLVCAHVRCERGVGRVDEHLEAGVGGVGDEVPAAA
jgi:hypothetical protein